MKRKNKRPDQALFYGHALRPLLEVASNVEYDS